MTEKGIKSPMVRNSEKNNDLSNPVWSQTVDLG